MSKENEGGTATVEPPKVKPKKRPPGLMPQWKVLLHNDDKNTIDYVIHSLVELTPLTVNEAIQRTQEAHKQKLALILVTHKERAELYQEQLTSKGLTVTIEPDEK